MSSMGAYVLTFLLAAVGAASAAPFNPNAAGDTMPDFSPLQERYGELSSLGLSELQILYDMLMEEYQDSQSKPYQDSLIPAPEERYLSSFSSDLPMKRYLSSFSSDLPMKRYLSSFSSDLPMKRYLSSFSKGPPMKRYLSSFSSDLPMKRYLSSLSSDLPMKRYLSSLSSELPMKRYLSSLSSELPMKRYLSSLSSDLPNKRNVDVLAEGMVPNSYLDALSRLLPDKQANSEQAVLEATTAISFEDKEALKEALSNFMNNMADLDGYKENSKP